MRAVQQTRWLRRASTLLHQSVCRKTESLIKGPLVFYSTSSRVNTGVFAFSVDGLSDHAKRLHKEVNEFMECYILPVEKELFEHSSSEAKWTVHPIIEELKAKAKQNGLWNLFVTKDADPEGHYGSGLTNAEYAHFMELMGRSPFAPEVFNCSAPDSGNMELLLRFGNADQKRTWLEPLLEGRIRSTFSMTEPHSSSPDGLKSEITKDCEDYIINGHKWYTSGTFHPNCKICIFMGRTDMGAERENHYSMILVPMDSPSIERVRALNVFGYFDAPFGHAELIFNNVRVPASNMIIGPGKGLQIARGRMGYQRVRHCSRLLGVAERSLDLMKKRVTERIAFGKPLMEQGTIQADIAQSRMEIEQSRLLTLKAAHLVDTVDYKTAAKDLAIMMKAVPHMTSRVVDRAIQAHGGAGLSGDFPLAYFYAATRVSRLGDVSGMIAKLEMKSLGGKAS